MSTSVGRGRFAPSPTGPLHFGSLVAAVGSYLNAKSKQYQWLVRIEDLDPPREQPGAVDSILRTLDAFALHWDGTVLMQSQRSERYLETIDVLKGQGLVYACTCSRRDIEAESPPGIDGLRYTGTCRHLNLPPRDTALRLITPDTDIAFEDRIQGHQAQNLQREIGDFVIRRREQLFSYQLAVVVDDADQQITEVFRGTDLLDSTPRQIYLQQRLALPTPEYLHCPIAVNAAGQKLSKQNLASPLSLDDPSKSLIAAMKFLGQPVPSALDSAPADEILQWGVNYWDIDRVPHILKMTVEAP